MQESRIAYRFAETVEAGQTGSLSPLRIRQDGTIESVGYRIYPGAELNLQLKIEVYDKQDNKYYPLIELEGKQYIDGDDDSEVVSVSLPVKVDDEIVIRAKNKGAYSLDYYVLIIIDYLAGTERAVV